MPKIFNFIKDIHTRYYPKYLFIVAFLLLSFLIFSSSFPVNSVFEGDLTVSQLGFTSRGGKKFTVIKNNKSVSNIKINRLGVSFLRKVSPLDKVIITGVQSFTFPPGEYQSNSNSFFNQKVIEPLKINFKNNQTRLSIKPSDKSTSLLAVSELNIQPNVTVENLAYDSHNKRLYMSLNHNQVDSPNTLSLDLGIKELQIEIDGEYSLPKLGKTGKKLDFSVKPSNSSLNIPLQRYVQLEFDVSESSKNSPKIEFGNRFRVKDVQLHIQQEDDNYTVISSILGGQIQMPQTEKKLNLHSGQFLLSEAANISQPEKNIPDDLSCLENAKPNIYLIRNIKTNSEGINFRIIGETNRIQSGFDPCFPVDWIQVSWLGKLFNQEIHPAILTLFTGVLTGLFAWIAKK